MTSEDDDFRDDPSLGKSLFTDDTVLQTREDLDGLLDQMLLNTGVCRSDYYQKRAVRPLALATVATRSCKIDCRTPHDVAEPTCRSIGSTLRGKAVR
jgi:hypothetical protein